jgi:murein DD-endopeptidase MepM/ murein hydrolase activator NlpD
MKKEIELIITSLYKSKTYQRRFTLWQTRIIIGFIILFIGLAGLGVYLLHYTNQQNIAIRYLYERNFQLEQENKKVAELQNRMNYLESERTKIALMLGADKNPPPLSLENLDEAYKPFNQPETATTTSIWRVAPTTGYLISRGVSANHDGLDFAVQLGMPVFAVGSGVVEDVDVDTFYGNYIKLGIGDYKAFYGHLYKTIKQQGEDINAGDIIGYVGSSGKSSAPHLHFELWQVKDNKKTRLDPEKELKTLLKPRLKTEQ